MMTTDRFWSLTEKIDRRALERVDEVRAVAPLRKALSALTESELNEYHDFLCQALYEIDGEVYADNAGESGESGDGFLYSRCYVVAQGRAHYEKVRLDPSLMPKSLDQWCEALLSVVSKAWSDVTGRDSEEWENGSPVSYETGSNAERWTALPVSIRLSDPDEVLFNEPNLQRAATRAGHSFRAKQYRQVVLLLGPHRAQLSPKLLRMLLESEAAES